MSRQQGFSVVEGLLVVLVLAAVGFGGWNLWDKNNKSDSMQPKAGTAQNESEEKIPAYSYALPDSWAEITCGKEGSQGNPIYHLAFPKSDKAKNCDDRVNTTLLHKSPYTNSETSSEEIEKLRSCMTEAEQKEWKERKPLESYKCEETTINGVKTLVTTADYGGGLILTYESRGNKMWFNITYYGDAKGTLSDTDIIKEIAESLKFY